MSNQQPMIHLTSPIALVDEKVRITVTGLTPGQTEHVVYRSALKSLKHTKMGAPKGTHAMNDPRMAK
jgi:hypothetical protein